MTRTRLLVSAAAVALMGAVVLMPAHLNAGIASANLAVTAAVIPMCTITGGTLDFGNYDPIVANAGATQNLDKSTTFTVTCTKGASGVFVGADNGLNYVANRRLKSGTNYLNYELYTSSGYSTVWGTTSANGLAVTPNGKTAVTMSVYGRVPGNQDQPVGTYTDTVVMTVNF